MERLSSTAPPCHDRTPRPNVRLHDRRLMTDLTSWLKQTWAFEMGFLQSADETDLNAFYPMSGPICDPSCPKKNNTRPSTVLQMTTFSRTGIEHGDPVTYNMKAMKRKNNWDQLNLPQLYRHISMKANSCPMHNIFEVVLHLLYFDTVLHRSPNSVIRVMGRHPLSLPLSIPIAVVRTHSFSDTTLTLDNLLYSIDHPFNPYYTHLTI